MSILYTTQSGKGPTIVMLHGFLSSSRYYSRFKKRFEIDHTVVLVDLLGSGKSSRPKELVSYDLQVKALHDTLTQLDITEPFELVGHSMGALIAARYAVTYPQKVNSLILFNAPLFRDRAQAEESIAATGRHYRAALIHPKRRYVWRFLKLLPRLRTRLSGPINFQDSLQTHYLAREGGYQQIITEAVLFDDLQKLSIPTLLIVGTRDRRVYQKNVHRTNMLVNVTVEIIDSGHHTIVHSPEIAENFLRRHTHQR